MKTKNYMVGKTWLYVINVQLDLCYGYFPVTLHCAVTIMTDDDYSLSTCKCLSDTDSIYYIVTSANNL